MDDSGRAAETGPVGPRRPEVVVVGAGPVGLFLALGLARAGHSVLVLEKEPRTAEHSRAPAIWPRTQELLAEVGVAETFLARGIALGRVELVDAATGRVLLSLPLEELAGETRYPQLLIVPQSVTERLLLEAVRSEPTAEVRFSSEVEEVAGGQDVVRVAHRGEDGERRTVVAAFAAGCDGAHSTVREAIGVSFDGGTYGTLAALADLELADDRDLPFPRLATEEVVAVGIRISERRWRLILPFSAAGDGEGERPLDERGRREAIVEGVNQFTDRLTRLLLFREGRLIRPMLRTADLALRIPPVRRRFLRRIAMLA